jgi:hypothetical protein
VTIDQMIDEWDGCAPIVPHTVDTWPTVDVQSIGDVPQVGATGGDSC